MTIDNNVSVEFIEKNHITIKTKGIDNPANNVYYFKITREDLKRN